MTFSQDMDLAEINMFAFNQALEALKALASGEAEVVRDSDDEVIGVRWTPPELDCHEEIFWN